MYIAGRISEHTVVEVSGFYTTGNPPIQIIQKNLVANLGGNPTDYYIFEIEDESSDMAQKVFDGQEFDAVWNGDAIVDLDFTPEESKRWLKVTANKTEVVKDGQDEVDMTIEILKPDGVTRDTDFNGRVRVNIGTPYTPMALRIGFKQGLATRKFKPEAFGRYRYPSTGKRFVSNGDKFRVKNEIEIDSINEV
ncbi:MAG TPA: hypothetical protein EYP60_04335 [bacterium (Candidatus Stahlbacteria)]|nr:hypothetical protein [Candidatus Stahlbacteria bacterium]